MKIYTLSVLIVALFYGVLGQASVRNNEILGKWYAPYGDGGPAGYPPESILTFDLSGTVKLERILEEDQHTNYVVNYPMQVTSDTLVMTKDVEGCFEFDSTEIPAGSTIQYKIVDDKLITVAGPGMARTFTRPTQEQLKKFQDAISKECK